MRVPHFEPLTSHLLLGVVCAILLCAPGCRPYSVPRNDLCAGEPFFPNWQGGEWSWESSRSRLVLDLLPSAGKNAEGNADFFVATYQKYLRRPYLAGCCGCPFHPSCSTYSRLALQTYGELVGVALTLDRLLVRENFGRDQYYPKICVGSREVLFDPIP